ncbi:YggT family protein [Lactobacillus bombi]|nr:YggT family protein [Bombilactobacillus bombi]
MPIIIIELFDLYKWLIVIYCLMSWLPGAATSKLGVWLGKIVNPFLSIFDRFIPPIFGISFSPIFALIVLEFIERFISGIF